MTDGPYSEIDPDEVGLAHELTEIQQREVRNLTLLCVEEDLGVETSAQIDKWGVQKHPSIYPSMVGDMSPTARYALQSELRWKRQYEDDVRKGNTNWGTILLEEVAEAITEASKGESEELYEEVVQVAAVAMQWAACVRERIE